MSTSIAPIAEQISAGQIGRASDRFSDRCRTNAASLPRDTVQLILEEEGDALAQEMFEVLRARVERRASIITRRVTVNRRCSPQEALDATKCKQYTDRKVVDAMPRGEGEEVEVYFFKPRPEAYKGGAITDEALEKEFEFYSLKPVDPYSLSAVNEADPAFADEKPNGTHWKNAEGKWEYAAFSRWGGERSVSVRRGGDAWDDDWWFGGLRK